MLCWENSWQHLSLETNIMNVCMQRNNVWSKCGCEGNSLLFIWLWPVSFCVISLDWKLSESFSRLILLPDFSEWAHLYLNWMWESQHFIINALVSPQDVPCNARYTQQRLEIEIEVSWIMEWLISNTLYSSNITCSCNPIHYPYWENCNYRDLRIKFPCFSLWGKHWIMYILYILYWYW